MSKPNIMTDDAGNFYEAWWRMTCDACGAQHDVEDSHKTEDDRDICHECFSTLWNAASEAHTRMMRENGIMFSVFSPDLDEMLEEHGHLLEGRKPLP